MSKQAGIGGSEGLEAEEMDLAMALAGGGGGNSNAQCEECTEEEGRRWRGDGFWCKCKVRSH